MRISTSAIYDANVSILNQQQSRLLHTQEQLATGRRMLTPSDDPIASARALDVSQADALNTQYDTNRNVARSNYSLADGNMQSVVDLLQYVRERAVQAGGAISAANRQAIGADLAIRMDELKGLANTTDGQGNYLFSGYQGKTVPFVGTAAGVQYQGDDGQRMVQVSGSRQLAASDSGADVFMRIKNGNGTFVTQAAAGNTGSGLVAQGVVTNPAALTGDSYRVNFNVVAGVTTYDIVDTTTATTLSAGNAYTSGNAISFAGMQISVSGAPANGDSFTTAPSSNESLFKTLADLVASLNAAGSSTNTQTLNSINKALGQLDNGLSKVLSVRASVGARMNEIDSLKTAGDDLGLSFKSTLSQLQDVDYNQGVSDMNQQQVALQAAQKTFKQVSDMSLFNYI
ncbi:MAG TPA: flagellar hook-associated protein FlgL [Gallionellaceae bacterium]|nr:flagellar hook-associated protein FlgL [Gallionellaceae bacterium]